MNNDIKEYTTPSGKKRYRFNLYVGVDETTGHSIQIRKQGYKSKKEAQEAYLNYQLKVIKGEYIPESKGHITFNKLYVMWLKIYRETVKTSTYATTTRYFEDHILKQLGSKYIDKLTVLDCQKAVNIWFNDAPKTYKRFMRYTNNVLNYGINNLELISKNPMNKVIPPKAKNKPKPFTDFYSKDELNIFLRDAKEYNFKYFVFFRLLAYSGMRKGEALALKWSDINFKDNTISINKDVTVGLNNELYEDTPKTENSFRTLDMDATTMEYLKEWRLMQQKTMLKLGYNFLNSDNLLFSTINNGYLSMSKPRQWNVAICKKYKLRRIKIHGFRHTHASLLFEAGASMNEVKARLGHADINTTMNIYTHVTDDQKKDTANKLVRLLEGK
ncbi:site-specific integrase [Lactobacillus amylovorus DSM 20531]|uniref:tyrosine-type recombinase/integrase n=1 Tax=Lactobacillus amylovorus TaxID=1604 RepID=UPI0006F0CEF3|nr:tyrosine-type recombinase/integrase [Lactobacillus amylovorus]ATO53770.1 site-specific integrase [Lactobacillus amylovorus DSM 20531]KRK44444.1 bacteriophage integrase [Lactobacillus amylovorus DSM 20531]MCT3592234.1 site-specific integrase [Lactobacillus amylovorus]